MTTKGVFTSSWYTLLILPVLLFVSACSSTEPGVDQEFLESLQGQLLTAGCLSDDDQEPFPSPAPGTSYVDIEQALRHYSMGLYLIDFQDSLKPQLLFGAVNDQSIDWPDSMSASLSFDGAQIAVIASKGDETAEIYVARIDGDTWQQATHDSWPKYDLAWSPDGTRIAFSARGEDTNGDGSINEDDAIEIYTISTDGSDLQQITHNEGRSTNPGWSPNGEWMVYRLRTKQGRMHIDGLYLLDLKTGESRELVPGGGIAAPVSWSPDGCSIAIAASSGNEEELWFGTDIYVRDIETGSRVKLTDTRRYTPYRGGDSGGIHLSNPVWSPDGKAIAFAWMWIDWDKQAIFVVSRDGSHLSQLTDWSQFGQIPLSWRP